MAPSVRINVQLDYETWKEAEDLAKREKISLSALVREALEFRLTNDLQITYERKLAATSETPNVPGEAG